jgi:hypothetical protein
MTPERDKRESLAEVLRRLFAEVVKEPVPEPIKRTLEQLK